MIRPLLRHLRVHSPSIVLLAYVVAKIIQAMPLPERVALHFTMAGRPDDWGSPWIGILLPLVFMVGIIAMGVFMSYQGARQEKRKTFIGFALAIPAIVSLLAVVTLEWLKTTAQSDPRLVMPWTAIAATMAATLAATAILEMTRSFVPSSLHVESENAGELQAAIARALASDRPWTYWEMQNPRYVNLLSIGLILLSLLGAALVYLNTSSWLPSGLIALSSLIGAATYGGLRVQVTPERLVLRLGALGLRLLRIDCRDISDIRVQQFSPLGDFGGWGPGRFGRPAWAVCDGRRRFVLAFYFRGTRGVRIARSNGKLYLIGSDHPDRLAAVLTEVAKAAGQRA